MDSFDDLLGSSRAALEENPFADDPFSRPRSASPDPWATPFGATDSTDVFGSSASHFATSDTFVSHTTAFETTVTTKPEPVSSVDPLDYAAHHDKDTADLNEPLATATLQSPGFRESLPSITTDRQPTKEPEVTLLPPLLDEVDKGAARIESEETETSVKQDKNRLYAPEGLDSPSKSGSSFASFQTASSTVAFKSPLDPTPSLIVERSVTGFSIGGEAAGGWHTQTEERMPWHQPDIAPAVSLPSFAASTSAADEDSDDDKPILQAHQEKQQQQREVSTAKKDDKGLQPVFVITVDDPQKVGDPIRSFTMYTVHTRTTSPLFQKSSFSVLRRYSDFLWVYETLSANNPGVVVPPVPEKNTFGRFDDQFVKQRRLALEKCIQKIANHPVLMKDPDLRFFLESDNFALDMKHRKAELAQERGGIIASIGQSIAGPRFHENDEWFDRRKSYLDSLEFQLRGLVKAIELVAKHRQELSTATGEFAQNLGDLATSDVSKQLSQSLAGLAEVQRKAQDLQTVQADQDMATLMATADEYSRLINSVRLAFNSRIRVYYSWKSAESDLLRTKQTHERNRAQGRIPPERLGHSLSLIAEAERRASEAKLEFDQVSKLVKSEVARFEQERIQDFKDSLQVFLDGMIVRQKELIAAWEAYQQILLKKTGDNQGVSSLPMPVASEAS